MAIEMLGSATKPPSVVCLAQQSQVPRKLRPEDCLTRSLQAKLGTMVRLPPHKDKTKFTAHPQNTLQAFVQI